MTGATPAGDAASALPGPLLRALLVSIAGAIALFTVGALLASTVGLLFVAGIAGGAVGLVLARAAVPRESPRGPSRPSSRSSVAWIAIGLALAAVVVGAVAIWAFARQEGGTLGLLDYLLETFGPFVPAEALIAALAAWWGANSGPLQS